MKNTFEWTNPTGTELKLEISYTEKLVEEVLDADGYEINTGKKEIRVDANLVLFVNGKKVEDCWNVEFWRIIDVKDARLNAMGLTKKIWGLKTIFTAEIATEIEKFIADYIAANKVEEVVEVETAIAKEEKEVEVAAAKEIIARAERQTDIPTYKVARAREKAYNDINNEGEEGYVPHIIDIDEYNRALNIINS